MVEQQLEVFMILLGTALVVGLLVAAGMWSARRTARRLDQVWKEVAKAVGGSFRIGQDARIKGHTRTIFARIDKQSVVVAQRAKSQKFPPFTQVSTGTAGAKDLKIEIYDQQPLDTLGAFLGAQDVRVGDPSFDSRFMIKANDEELARAWLLPEVRKQMRLVQGYRFTIEQDQVRAQLEWPEENAERLARVIHLVALLARSSYVLWERWKSIAYGLRGALNSPQPVWTADGAMSIATQWRGVPIVIDAFRMPRPKGIHATHRTVTRIRGRRLSMQGEGFALRRSSTIAQLTQSSEGAKTLDPALAELYAFESQSPPKTLTRLNQELSMQIARLAPEQISADEHQIELILPGVELELDRLMQAREIVGQLASAQEWGNHAGPYR